MSTVPVQRNPKSVRLMVLGFAIVLGAEAAWLLAPQILRAPLPYLPQGKTAIADASAQVERAEFASAAGWPRGDLAEDYAVAADSKWLDPSFSPDNASAPVSETELGRAPYSARLWLLLATAHARAGWKDAKTLAQLKMSYYTAPNDARLIPQRLSIATQPAAIGDDEMQALVAQEVRTILSRRTELKPAIAAAYGSTNAAGRSFLDESVAPLDPDFAAQLKSSSAPK